MRRAMKQLIALFSDLLILDECEIYGQLKLIKRNKLTSDSTTILLHTETETGEKRCIHALLNRLLIIICANFFIGYLYT